MACECCIYLARKLTDNQETLKTIYYSLVQPYFDYCADVVLGDCSKTRADKLQKLQNRAARGLSLGLITLSDHQMSKFSRVVKLRRKRKKACISYNV